MEGWGYIFKQSEQKHVILFTLHILQIKKIHMEARTFLTQCLSAQVFCFQKLTQI